MPRMDAAVVKEEISTETVYRLKSEQARSKQQIQSLQSQLDRFKKQLFGWKSEKCLVECRTAGGNAQT